MHALLSYPAVLDQPHYMTREQLQSMLAAADALSAGRPFSSLLTGCTHHAHALRELQELYRVDVTLAWGPSEWMEYRELTLRH